LFSGDNFRTTNSRKPINSSKVADFRLVVLKKETTITSWGWSLGPCDVTHEKTQIKNFPNLFNRNCKTFRIFPGLSAWHDFGFCGP